MEPLNKQVEKLNRCGEGAVRCEERLQVRADHTCMQAHPDHIIIFSSFPRVSVFIANLHEHGGGVDVVGQALHQFDKCGSL